MISKDVFALGQTQRGLADAFRASKTELVVADDTCYHSVSSDTQRGKWEMGGRRRGRVNTGAHTFLALR